MDGPVLLCMGTRSEIIKMAPLHRALKRREVPVAVLHTGQREELAWPLFEFFGMHPDRIVKLVRTSDSLAHLSALLLEELNGVFLGFNPAAVLVHGATSSALMSALAAFYRKIPVGHVEAGLRSGAMYDPFPEEKNRELIARLAQWHFAPTELAKSNLLREGVDPARIHKVGNTAIDAARWGSRHVDGLPGQGVTVLPESLAALPGTLIGKRLILVTAHRRENWGEGIESIARAVCQALVESNDICVVWPVDTHPRVQSAVHAAMAGLQRDAASRLFLAEPLTYAALLWVLRHAWLAMTDSGGLQEEAIAMRVPVFVLRETTERPELITAGGGIVVGNDARTILDKLATLASSEPLHTRMRQAINPFGDGGTGEAIANILCDALGTADHELEDAHH
jgi:UDP-N-acetylglucosamine 2-epimerase (non-hydrolysing)